MIYRIAFSENARSNLLSYYQYAAKNAPHTAANWLERFELEINNLSNRPDTWPIAPESEFLKFPLRQKLFGKRPYVYRILFTIENNDVRILHIRRASMDLATLAEIHGDFDK